MHLREVAPALCALVSVVPRYVTAEGSSLSSGDWFLLEAVRLALPHPGAGGRWLDSTALCWAPGSKPARK